MGAKEEIKVFFTSIKLFFNAKAWHFHDIHVILLIPGDVGIRNCICVSFCKKKRVISFVELWDLMLEFCQTVVTQLNKKFPFIVKAGILLFLYVSQIKVCFDFKNRSAVGVRGGRFNRLKVSGTDRSSIRTPSESDRIKAEYKRNPEPSVYHLRINTLDSHH